MKALLVCALFCAVLSAQIPSVTGPSAPQTPLPPNTVVATVAGTNVTIDDVRKMTENAPPQLLQFLKQQPQNFIQQMFLFRFLSAEGDKLKLAEQSPLKEQIETERAWVIANAMVNHERDYYQVTGQQIEEFYHLNESRWQQAKIKAILVGFKPGAAAPVNPKDMEEAAKQALSGAHPANQRSEDEAKSLAADLVKQIRAGADFVKLVEQYSDDSSSKGSGGEFPPVKATSPYPEDLKKAIFALKPGEVSDPVKQPSGFYIIRMEEKTIQPLNDVREPIVQEMRQSHLNDWLKSLNSRFTPVVQKPEFFVQPQLYLEPAAPAPKP